MTKEDLEEVRLGNSWSDLSTKEEMEICGVGVGTPEQATKLIISTLLLASCLTKTTILW